MIYLTAFRPSLESVRGALGDNMIVYFIEDDQKLFDEVKKMVESCLGDVKLIGYTPNELKDSEFMPDSSGLVLFDLDCPNVNTISLFEKIHRRIRIPIVILDDVRIGSSRMMKALHLGASDYLFKPIINSHLISAIVTRSKGEEKIWRTHSIAGV